MIVINIVIANLQEEQESSSAYAVKSKESASETHDRAGGNCDLPRLAEKGGARYERAKHILAYSYSAWAQSAH